LLLHPLPSLATVGAAIGFALLFGLRPADPRLWTLGLTMLLAQFSISALNDWADSDRDERAGRVRPLPLGLLARSQALGVAIGCAALAMVFAAGLGRASVVLVTLGIAAGWLYDVGLKVTPLSFLPFAVAFPLLPLWAATVGGRPVGSLGWLLVAGPPLATAIHLGDAVPDRERDAAAGARTLAVALGRPGAELGAGVAVAAGGSLLAAGIWGHHPRAGLALGALGLGAALGYIGLAAFEGGRPLGRWVLAGGALLVAVLALAFS